MKLLCVSDQIDPLIYSSTIKERFKDVDMVVSAGDLPAEYLGFIVTVLNLPLYFVLGNHDDYETTRLYGYAAEVIPKFDDRKESVHGAIDVGSTARTEGKLLIAGLPGCMRYNRGQNQYTDAQMWLKTFALIPKLLMNKLRYGRYLDILLTHAPPFGLHDRQDLCHRGFRSFLWFMRIFKPKYLIHGHIHLYDMNDVRVSRYEGTTVINAFGHFMLDLDKNDGHQ
jgi:calcineurin-like phosphoesterase family protein